MNYCLVEVIKRCFPLESNLVKEFKKIECKCRFGPLNEAGYYPNRKSCTQWGGDGLLMGLQSQKSTLTRCTLLTLMSFLIVCGRLYPFWHISAFPFTLRAHLAALYIQISHHLHSLSIPFTASPYIPLSTATYTGMLPLSCHTSRRQSRYTRTVMRSLSSS